MSDIPEAPSGTKPLTRIDRKRQEIYNERRKRAINKGVPEEQVDAVLAREDFDRLPLEQRVHHMIDAAFQRLARELVNLQYNDQLLSAAMDVNFRTIAKLLEKLGIPRDQQLQLLKETKEEMEAEMKAAEEAKNKAAGDAAAVELKAQTDKAGEPPPPPDEATVFGG